MNSIKQVEKIGKLNCMELVVETLDLRRLASALLHVKLVTNLALFFVLT
jgi:hypothetical protein